MNCFSCFSSDEKKAARRHNDNNKRSKQRPSGARHGAKEHVSPAPRHGHHNHHRQGNALVIPYVCPHFCLMFLRTLSYKIILCKNNSSFLQNIIPKRGIAHNGILNIRRTAMLTITTIYRQQTLEIKTLLLKHLHSANWPLPPRISDKSTF